ncbi:MAG TPA: DUF362 domain-containing protein [Candidatus Acidoferrum sp.]|nr:DUF362 domain-containing protein [Candidatus Acidoferrum sp.]
MKENAHPNIRRISAVKATYETAYQDLTRALDLTGPLRVNNDAIAIKINLCAARTPESGAITHPLILDALLHNLRDRYPDITIRVVESDATAARPEVFKDWFGFTPILQKYNAEWCNLSTTESVMKQVNGRFLKQIPVPKIFEESFFITLPKLKTHVLTGITCCLKNQFGCLPKVRKIIYHKHLDDVIVDSNLVMKPDFCVVDGIIAMGGNLGPSVGVPIPLKAIICGDDPVAVDTYCAKLVGFNPSQLGHIRKAAKSGIGTMNYIQVGDDIPKVDFEVNKLQMTLLKLGSKLSKRSKR